MNSEGIKARIAIGRYKNGDVGYIYDYDQLKQLKIPEDSHLNGHFYLVEGTVFEFINMKFKINAIRTNFLGSPSNITLTVSSENSKPTETLFSFNYEISLFVEDVE